ncbi:MAG: membrane dipeptidase [Spirochaetia bacterium]|nr:membrane dipeptidase [Spirochaetia bacterium]
MERYAGYAVADCHSDALLPVVGQSLVPGETGKRDFFARNVIGHMDLPRLEAGHVACQAFACFAGESIPPEGAKAVTDMLLDSLDAILAQAGPRMRRILSAADAEAARRDGTVGALATIEGGECLEGDLALLGHFHGRGVRMLGLTHNKRNELGRGAKAEGTDGLSDFGKAVIRECARLGVVVDVSHLSDQALDDALKTTDAPLVASHSNCRALCCHVRNLRDDQIIDIGRTGGLVAATCVPYFVERQKGMANLGRLADHIERVARLAGIEHVALGSDFEGYDPSYGATVPDAAGWPLLADELERRGFSRGEVDRVFWGNWLAVFKSVAG